MCVELPHGSRCLLTLRHLCYCRLEEICFRRRDGIVKILGTIICVSGAVTMTAYKGMVVYQHGVEATQPPGLQGYTQPFKHLAGYGLHSSILQFQIGNYELGGLCLMFNCISWAVYLILQVCHLNPNMSKFCKSSAIKHATMVDLNCEFVNNARCEYEDSYASSENGLTDNRILVDLAQQS